MIRVGLTGGIGSGKTTVAHIFESLCVPIYYADDRAKFLLDQDVELRQQVITEFGAHVYTEDGDLDKAKLATIVFKDAAKLADLNALVHPAVGRDYRAWCETMINASVYSIKEAAILFETGIHREMDLNILVTAPETLRIRRVIERDGVTEDQVRARMERQWPDGDKIPLADFLIVNDGEHSLIEQVTQLHQLILDPTTSSGI